MRINNFDTLCAWHRCPLDENKTVSTDVSKVDLSFFANKPGINFYTYIDAVKYQLFGEEFSDGVASFDVRFDDENYKKVLAAWNNRKDKSHKNAYKYKSSEHFEYKGSYREHAKVCLFESTGTVQYVNINVMGTDVRLETLEQVLEYKQTYGREKDNKDLSAL